MGQIRPWAACGGRSTARCNKDDACGSCRSTSRQTFACIRQSEWYWQCSPGSESPAPAPAPAPVPSPSPAPVPPVAGDGTLRDILTESMFEELFPHRSNAACKQDKRPDGSTIPGGFYEYAALEAAATYFPGFLTEGTLEQRKRELAAFLGQISHETTGGWSTAPGGAQAWGLCWKEEVGCEGGQCTQYCAPGDPCTANGENVPCTCASGKTYHGRGPMQLSWNYNYAPAGVALRPFVNDPNLDLLADPDRITADPKLAFATAIYFWMTPRENKPSCHDVMVDKWTPSAVDLAGNRRAGYGVTTNIINGGLECNRPGDSRVEDRVKFYERYAGILGVSPGSNLYCGDQRPFGLDAAVAKSTAPVSTSVTARVDRKGRTCAELPKRACKKKRWCKFNRDSQTCEGGAGGVVDETSEVVRMDRKGRTCADFRRRKCNKKKWCTFNTSSRICEDAAVAPGMAEAAESAARMDRKGRTCADYGKRLCKKRKWCRFGRDSQTCEEKEAGYLRG